ncbi:MAG: hypothetical protein GX493_03805 [Firmicutes bacterium]|nr:hypothetical protein [Bacillota bacterium]
MVFLLLSFSLFCSAAYYTTVVRRVATGRRNRPGGDFLTPAERLALAQEAAIRCGLPASMVVTADPHLVRGDFLPGGGTEIALVAELSSHSGFLVLLAPTADGWRPITHVGPEELGVPTSVAPLLIPGRHGAALVLTDLADQMAGAFSRREECSVFGVKDGKWRRLWRRTIESVAYWNLAWERPPGAGWRGLAGRADWRIEKAGDACLIAVAYRNSLTEAPAQATLPEAHRFVPRRQVTGREEYRWDPAYDLFVLGYGRIKNSPRLLGPDARPLEPPVRLLPGQRVAILADEATTPKGLSGRACLLRVYAAGREGFLSPAAVDRSSS